MNTQLPPEPVGTPRTIGTHIYQVHFDPRITGPEAYYVTRDGVIVAQELRLRDCWEFIRGSGLSP